MSIPTIKPMKVNFDSEEERQNFIDWAEGKNKKEPENIEEVRQGVKKAREMRKRGNFND
ncbi:hypothetical protein [Salibacterium qingdaonense]|uniref:hypothetical protein n=1 Tax=Salibacterium qingdaonense TaxID=266892 RepID=UPI0015A6483F|nr:hypothetical protein [Salibacterium qingdaonense]